MRDHAWLTACAYALAADVRRRAAADPLPHARPAVERRRLPPRQQLRLRFDTKEEAIAYAEREGIAYRVEEPTESRRRTMSYADNFKFNRTAPWTH